MPRQKVNFHLRALEDHGLVELVEERPRRGLTERVVQATARSYVISPGALGRSGADPSRTDRLSTRYLLAVAARLLREVGLLAGRADAAGQRLPTLTLDTEIRFASAADRAAFTADLTAAVTALVADHHDEAAPRGRWHRLLVAAHPRPGERHDHEATPAASPATEPVADASRRRPRGMTMSETPPGTPAERTRSLDLSVEVPGTPEESGTTSTTACARGGSCSCSTSGSTWSTSPEGPRPRRCRPPHGVPPTAFVAVEGRTAPCSLSVWAYLYGDDRDHLAADVAADWQRWFEAHAPAVAG